MPPTSRRSKFRKGLSTLYLPHYDALCELLPEHWQPIQGLRTIEEQDYLYTQGRSRPGAIVTWAKGGKSAHNYGCATDWIRFEGPLPLWNLKDWTEYEQALEKVGLRWGSDWGDRPHNELPITCSWSHVHQILNAQGMLAAQQHIESNLIR